MEDKQASATRAPRPGEAGSQAPRFKGDTVRQKYEKEFLSQIFPAGTTFIRTRNKYSQGRFWSKGEVSPPLVKDGPPPGPGWALHRTPDLSSVDPDLAANTMAGVQRSRPSKPVGA